MRKINLYLLNIAVVISMVASLAGLGFAQQPANVFLNIRRGEETVQLANIFRANENGELFLEIAKNEVIELMPKDKNVKGLILTSSDKSKLDIVNGTMLVGVNPTGEDGIELSGAINSTPLNLNGLAKIKVVVLPNKFDEKIISEPTFLSYKVVKDAFGRRVAEYYLVIQVNIKNNNAGKQFLVQDVSVVFDPKQCRLMEQYFDNIPQAVNSADYETAFSEEECLKNYTANFKFPASISPIERDTILAAANTEKYRSKRYQIFRVLRFVADVGGGLTGFNILGPDGVNGFSFLGGTIFNSLENALPKNAEEKRQFLEKSVPEQNVLVNSRSSKKLNIFIPADRVFNQPSWEKYKKSVKEKLKKGQDDPLDFRRYMQLFLLATSNGVLIDENAETTNSKGGGAKGVIDKIRIP